MTILPFTPVFQSQLSSMLTAYFANDLHESIPEEIIRDRICPLIIQQCMSGIVDILLLTQREACVGFVIYQIDKPESDWCKREGWGFIREFYIDQSFRRQGWGKKLAAAAESALLAKSASNLYLSTSTALPFWQSCGYQPDSCQVSESGLTLVKSIVPTAMKQENRL